MGQDNTEDRSRRADDENLVHQAVRYVGLGKMLMGSTMAIVLGTFGIASALGSKTDNADYKAHVQYEERRISTLESQQIVLDTMQRISIRQQEKMEVKLDKVLASNGLPFVPAAPVVLPTPVPVLVVAAP